MEMEGFMTAFPVGFDSTKFNFEEDIEPSEPEKTAIRAQVFPEIPTFDNPKESN